MIVRKSQLIEALQRIDGDPLVFVDVDGQVSNHVKPVCFPATAEMIGRIEKEAVERPQVGEPVILL